MAERTWNQFLQQTWMRVPLWLTVSPLILQYFRITWIYRNDSTRFTRLAQSADRKSLNHVVESATPILIFVLPTRHVRQHECTIGHFRYYACCGINSRAWFRTLSTGVDTHVVDSGPNKDIFSRYWFGQNIRSIFPQIPKSEFKFRKISEFVKKLIWCFDQIDLIDLIEKKSINRSNQIFPALINIAPLAEFNFQ